MKFKNETSNHSHLVVLAIFQYLPRSKEAVGRGGPILGGWGGAHVLILIHILSASLFAGGR